MEGNESVRNYLDSINLMEGEDLEKLFVKEGQEDEKLEQIARYLEVMAPLEEYNDWMEPAAALLRSFKSEV